jgi:hypothetical protein
MLHHLENTCPWQECTFLYGKSKATFCTSGQRHLQRPQLKFMYPPFPLILTATGKIQVSPTQCIFQLFQFIITQTRKYIFLAGWCKYTSRSHLTHGIIFNLCTIAHHWPLTCLNTLPFCRRQSDKNHNYQQTLPWLKELCVHWMRSEHWPRMHWNDCRNN